MLSRIIKKLKIPMFILGAGVQSSLDYSDEFLLSISEPSKIFLDTVFESGGDITLRGDFSKYCLEKLGYKNLFVSGCPSLFMCGFSDNVLNKKIINRDCFNPMFNGQTVQEIDDSLYDRYPNSHFFDQGYYFDLLYEPNVLTDERFYRLNDSVKKLFLSRRIDGDMNYFLWRKSVLDKKFNFSYGSRLHGNIIAIQLGIPCFVKVIDSRVREIVELFNIPSNMSYRYNEKSDDLFELYNSIDYSIFNKTYLNQFLIFERYLNSNNIHNRLRDLHTDFINCLSKQEYFDYRKNIELDEKVNHLSSMHHCD